MSKQQNRRWWPRLAAQISTAPSLLNFSEQMMDLLIEELAEIIETEGGMLIP